MAEGWTEDKIEKLRDLWGRGFTGGDIATELGIGSRSAVIAKARRLGLEPRFSPLNEARTLTDREIIAFERAVDLVAEQDLILGEAARRVGLSLPRFMTMWRAMCAEGGRQYS